MKDGEGGERVARADSQTFERALFSFMLCPRYLTSVGYNRYINAYIKGEGCMECCIYAPRGSSY